MANARQPNAAQGAAPERNSSSSLKTRASDTPASEQGRPPAVVPGTDSPENAWRAEGTVLLVDDEESVRLTGKRMLERMGFTVLTAGDGNEAIEVFARNADTIACVLLDVEMPRMNGGEAFHELRKIRSDVRVILSSGYSEEDVVQRLSEEGLAGFIQKPYRFVDLRSTMQEILAES